jgi:hypothetical protein
MNEMVPVLQGIWSGCCKPIFFFETDFLSLYYTELLRKHFYFEILALLTIINTLPRGYWQMTVPSIIIHVRLCDSRMFSNLSRRVCLLVVLLSDFCHLSDWWQRWSISSHRDCTAALFCMNIKVNWLHGCLQNIFVRVTFINIINLRVVKYLH